jgi:hypothetical protein
MEISAGYYIDKFKKNDEDVYFFPMSNNVFNNVKFSGFFNAAIINGGVWN